MKLRTLLQHQKSCSCLTAFFNNIRGSFEEINQSSLYSWTGRGEASAGLDGQVYQ